MKNRNNISRRKFLAGTLLIPAINITPRAFAQSLPMLDEQNPSAIALGFKHDVADVDSMMFPRRSTEAGGENQFCDNCILYTPTDDQWGACALFPGSSVAAKGWCNVWALKPA